MQQPVLVIKLGTTVITNADGIIAHGVIKKVIKEIAELIKNYRVVLVSSGPQLYSSLKFEKLYQQHLILPWPHL